MKTAAIIAEYNPFHNGHLFQAEQTRSMTGADFVIVIMSGNFVQRGAPALCDKYIRTEMALKSGADLVIELPVFYALSSAEWFARGATGILDQLGAVDYLCFGSECGDISILKQAAFELLHEPESFKLHLQKNLRSGMSFPSARIKALKSNPSAAYTAELEQTLNSPNNILGVEYCKALMLRQSSILPVTLKRNGAAYHDVTLQTFSSATAIRRSLETTANPSEIKAHVPPAVYNLMQAHNILSCPVTPDSYSLPLHCRLLTEAENGFNQYLDCSQNFSDKIIKNIEYFSSISAFASLLKSKDMTLTRINRILFHILTGITDRQAILSNKLQDAPYARILGFHKNASPLLRVINANASIPVLSKPAEAYNSLSSEAQVFFKQDILSAHLYEAVAAPVQKRLSKNEYRQPLMII